MVQADIDKVEGYEFPAAAVLLFLRVKPSAQWLGWVSEQIRKHDPPIEDADTVNKLVKELLPVGSNIGFEPFKLRGLSELKAADLSVFAWYNERWQAERTV